MKPDLTPPPCPGCQAAAELVPKRSRFRRRDKLLAIDSWTWQCPGDCPDPFTGERPLRFADPPLLRWEEDQAKEAWRTRYDEPMPVSERGQHPGPHRTVRIPVLLTPAEAARLDQVRGDLSRSDFLRRALKAG